MIYLGSKNRYCKDIIPIMNSYIKNNGTTEFYDVFTGGGKHCR